VRRNNACGFCFFIVTGSSLCIFKGKPYSYFYKKVVIIKLFYHFQNSSLDDNRLISCAAIKLARIVRGEVAESELLHIVFACYAIMTPRKRMKTL